MWLVYPGNLFEIIYHKSIPQKLLLKGALNVRFGVFRHVIHSLYGEHYLLCHYYDAIIPTDKYAFSYIQKFLFMQEVTFERIRSYEIARAAHVHTFSEWEQRALVHLRAYRWERHPASDFQWISESIQKKYTVTEWGFWNFNDFFVFVGVKSSLFFWKKKKAHTEGWVASQRMQQWHIFRMWFCHTQQHLWRVQIMSVSLHWVSGICN